MRTFLVGALMVVACAQDAAWATYTIPAGEHDATLAGRVPNDPIDGVVDVTGRDYQLALDPSAVYVLTDPVQPNDQRDWNKLPGLSDCGTIDLSADGAMFGWRWRPELAVLEITAYANNAGKHLTPPGDAALITLDADELATATPLRYRVTRDVDVYHFEITGTIAGLTIEAATTLPRRCVLDPIDDLAWAGGFYFGGTSTAPHEITATIHELGTVSP